ncbi:MAG: cyclodeaminase/cyclohydrolase family protein, partial [Candidatus Krumholzibacteria bacterium]|nr:cyclodeaminase/cyclohydrolase family protein [Candidatus Krumholzibacteria bacterium]
GYEKTFAEMEEIGIRGQELKAAFLADVDRDTEAFNSVMDAMRLPKKTDEDKAQRTAAIEEATKQATLVPLGVLERTKEAAKLARRVVEKGNVNSTSDAGVAALAARAAAEGAFLNVRINLPGIEDESFKKETLDKALELRNEVVNHTEKTVKLAEKSMD